MSWISRFVISKTRPFVLLKGSNTIGCLTNRCPIFDRGEMKIASMATLSSPSTTYTEIVSDTLMRIYQKYSDKPDINFAKTACQAATFLDQYLANTNNATDEKKSSVFLCHIYQMFVELIFNTLEIIETDRYTTNTHDLETIHLNIYTNTHFNIHCGSEKGPHGETSLFMLSYISRKIKFDYDISCEEIKQHAVHIDAYIEKIIQYLKKKHLDEDAQLPLNTKQ